MYLVAFINFHKLDIGLSHEVPDVGSAEFWDYFRAAETRIKYYAALYTLSASYEKRRRASNEFILEPAQKQEIHHYLNQIRRIVSEANLNDDKRDALSKKLNFFAEEVDKNRTSVAALASAYIFIKREVQDNAEWALGCLEKFEKIWSKLTKAKEALPPPAKGGDLEAPRRQIPPPEVETHGGDLDDEIPF